MGNLSGKNNSAISTKISDLITLSDVKYKNMAEHTQFSFEQFKENHMKHMDKKFDTHINTFKEHLEQKYDEVVINLKNENIELKKQIESLKKITSINTKPIINPNITLETRTSRGIEKSILEQSVENNTGTHVKDISKEIGRAHV